MLFRVQPRLAVMMLVFYFSIGSWIVTLSTYLLEPVGQGGLNYSAVDVGWLYSTFAFGGMIAPIDYGFAGRSLLSSGTGAGRGDDSSVPGCSFIAGNLCAETHHQLQAICPPRPLGERGRG